MRTGSEMDRAIVSMQSALRCCPDVRIVSDGRDLGNARAFLKKTEQFPIEKIQDESCKKAVERLAAMTVIGLNLRFIDGRDIGRFDPLIEKYRTLVRAAPETGLIEKDFEFFSAYERLFDEDYFIVGATSAFKKYGWAYYDPAITVPRVEAIISAVDLAPGATVLDFGCAVGFYVQAFLDKGFEARGMDISRYALEQARPDLKDRLVLFTETSLSQIQRETFDLVVAKDVLEHVPPVILSRLWPILTAMAKVVVMTVPVTSDGTGDYINAEDEHDFTHVVRKDARWWMNLLGKHAREDQGLCEKLKGQKAAGTLCAIVGHDGRAT